MKLIPLKTISYGPLVSAWCLCTYPNHQDGCKWYLGRESCPPQAPEFPTMYDTSNYYTITGHNAEMFMLRLKPGREPTIWFGVREFNLGQWVKTQKEKHPHRSDKQIRIPYLWQPKQEKKLAAEMQIERWTRSYPTEVLIRPEANLVNIFGTMRAHGHPLEKNPKDRIQLVAMIGKV